MVLAGLALGALGLPRGLMACDCGTLHGLLNSAADRVVGGIAPPLGQGIREAAAYNVANLRQDFTALRETLLMARDQVVLAIEAADKNSADRVTERTYEEGSQPKTVCGNDALGASLQLGSQNLRAASSDILGRAMERPGRYPRAVDYLNELSGEAWPGPKAALALGLSSGPRTYSLEETAQAEKLIEALSNPVPLPKLSEGKEASLPGKGYLALQKDYELRLSILQGALARGAAERAPTLEGLGDWARGKWADMGGTGEPPGLVGGRLSQETLFWYLANVRLASANWHEGSLPALPEAGLLRELVAIQAVGLELSRRQNELLGDIVRLLALQGIEGLNAGRRGAALAQHSLAEQAFQE
jgi:hypothetical protein